MSKTQSASTAEKPPISATIVALKAARKALAREVETAIEARRESMRYARWKRGEELVQTFVGTLLKIEGGREELERLASLVERRCGEGSNYERARKAALSSPTVEPQKLSRSSIDVWKCRHNEDWDPCHLSVIKQNAKSISQILNDDVLGLGADGKKAFAKWLDECKKITNEADAQPVDGAWYLSRIRASYDGGDSQFAELALAQGTCLEEIMEAANWLVRWAKERTATKPPSVVRLQSGSRNSQPKKVKTKREQIRQQRIDFAVPLRKQGKSWQEIFDVYRVTHYKSDPKASADTIRQMVEYYESSLD